MMETRIASFKSVFAGALVVTALLLQGCTDQTEGTDHHVSITYKCEHWQGKLCSKWLAEGMVSSRKNYLGCFPANATVISRTGPKSIATVRIEDELLGFNPVSGQTEFTVVRAWLHRESKLPGLMVRVQTDAGDVLASPTHNLAVGSTFKFARDVKVGDILVTPTGPVVAHGIAFENDHMGAYAPLTWGSNFFVGPAEPNASSFILAHSFAEVQAPKRMEGLFHALLSAVEFFVPSVHDIDDSKDTAYLHPVCRFFLRAFGIQISGDEDVQVVKIRQTLPIEASEQGDPPLRGRRLHGAHETEEAEKMSMALKVVLDHPPFMFEVPPSVLAENATSNATTN